jgi:hypothetical protein
MLRLACTVCSRSLSLDFAPTKGSLAESEVDSAADWAAGAHRASPASSSTTAPKLLAKTGGIGRNDRGGAKSRLSTLRALLGQCIAWQKVRFPIWSWFRMPYFNPYTHNVLFQFRFQDVVFHSRSQDVLLCSVRNHIGAAIDSRMGTTPVRSTLL